MDWFLRTVIHNLAVQAGGTAALVTVAIFILYASHTLTRKIAVIVAGSFAIVITLGLTALQWHFRIEYPGNYPLRFHFLFAAIPVAFGAFAACVAALVFFRFPAVPPN